MKFSKEVMQLGVTSPPYFLSRTFNHSKMADVENADVDENVNQNILPTNRYVNDERIWEHHFSEKLKCESGGGLNLTFYFVLMNKTEPLHLDK
jgi:hypothetical protein